MSRISAAPLGVQVDEAHQLTTLKLFCQLLSGATTVLIPMLMITGANAHEIMVTALLSGACWTSLALVVKGYPRQALYLIIGSILISACLAVLASGTVRSPDTVLFIGGVVTAGIFLKRNALIAAVGFSVVAVGILTWGQIEGFFKPNMSPVGASDWLVHAISIVLIGFMVYFSKVRTERAMQLQLLEYQRSLSLEVERDRVLMRFARIFRTSPSPILVQSASSLEILDVNPAFERCFGYTRVQITGGADKQLWADPQARKRFVDQVAREKRIDQHPIRGRRASGEVFDAVISCELGSETEDLLIITTVTDLSQHNRAMEHLRKSEERFAKAFNFIPLTLLIARMSDGLILEAHSPRNSLETIDIDTVRGKTSLEVGIWQEEKERQEFVDTLLRDGHINAQETQMRGHNGQLFDARIWAERIEIDDEDCILTCIVNTTAEKRRESQLRELAVAMTGQTSTTLLQELSRHMGSALQADMVLVGSVRDGQQVDTLVVWADGELAPNFSYPLLGTPCEQTLLTAELCTCPSEASTQFASDPRLSQAGIQAYAGQSLRSGQSEDKALLAVMWRRPTDITPEMRALISICASRANAELQRLRHEDKIHDLNTHLEQRVTQRTSELEKLNAELDSFAYSVSHDLKSPLRAIDGYAHILRAELQTDIDPSQVELLDRILAATHRMSNLIADLLALARVSQATLKIVPVNLSEMAHAVVAQLLADQPERKLETRIEPDVHCHCDASLARIALENLLGNAFKYARRQANAVIEFGRVSEPTEDQGLFYVRDNGVGFDMAQVDKLFKPFQRLHKPTEFEGSGIGLATVHRIVERHGGRIKAHSALGSGTTLLFTFACGTE